MIKIINQIPKFKVPRKILNKAFKTTLKYAGFKKKCSVCILFTSNQHIKKLNKAYRKKNTATDILAFSMTEGIKIKCPEKIITLGDIVISVPQTQRQADIIGHSLSKETVYLFIHGMLHLLGHKDNSAKEKNMMLKKQNVLFNEILKRKRTKGDRIRKR